MTKLQHRAEYGALRGLVRALGVVPWDRAGRIGAGVGALGYRPLGVRKRVAHEGEAHSRDFELQGIETALFQVADALSGCGPQGSVGRLMEARDVHAGKAVILYGARCFPGEGAEGVGAQVGRRFISATLEDAPRQSPNRPWGGKLW